ncbi:hypothetical protein Forpe1208_v016427 [Fusarium oxysporum f. sp. rapae]|uniref:Uncharacterized protein n=1 Tax=Fusarium oxysporum f. sp. rapae TaxID=485398 RepID=A0A8J5NI81_FUSOX|nr:hypothetical protein Forpe1208_v016427 [Fusarium oxysporum f. sp. rapae]
MGTDADEVEILGHFLIATARNGNSRYPFAVDIDSIHGGVSPETHTQSWKKEVLKECKRIAQHIPQPIRDTIGNKIRTRQDNDPVTQVPELFCQPDSINTQISQTPGEILQSPGVGIPSAFQASPTTGPERVSEERVSNSLSPEQPSAQNTTPVKGTSKQEDPSTFILVQNLESWATSPEGFLNVGGINVDCGIADYIQALKASQHLNTIRMRFALLQLYKSKKAWSQTTESLLRRLKIPRRTFNSWACEGENYFSLVAEKGLEVLFAKLKPRTKCRNPEKTTPPRGKKRPIDDLDTDTGCDSETIRKHHAKEVKTKSLTFTSEEVELPKLYVKDKSGEVVECREDHGKVKELFKTAADSIMACLEGFHRRAGLLIGDGSQDSRSATHSCQSGHCSSPATNDDAMVGTGQPLPQSPAERSTGDGISSSELGCTSTHFSASVPDGQAAVRGLREHTMAEDPPFPRSPNLSNGLHDQTKRFPSQQRAELSSSERTTKTWSTTGFPSPSHVEPGQEVASSDIRDAYDQQPDNTPNTRFSRTSLTPCQFQPPRSHPASEPSSSVSGLHSHGVVTQSALTWCEASLSASGQTTSTMRPTSIDSTSFTSFRSSENIPRLEDSTLPGLFQPICDSALASNRDFAFDAQATNYPGEASPESYWNMVNTMDDSSCNIWDINSASNSPQPES